MTPPRNLRVFMDDLRRDRDLVEIDHPVDARLEIAEIHRRVIAAGGPALLFRRVRGSDFPVVTNLFGTARRVERAFGRRPLEFVRSVVELAREAGAPGFSTLLRGASLAPRLLRSGSARRRRAPILAHREDGPDLGRLPITTSWPQDGGPFLTLPLVYTTDPTTAVPNLGLYRMQRHGPDRLGLHWQIAKGGGFHHHRAETLGVALPVTVNLGGPPAAILSAIAPLPENVPELLLASLVLERRLPVCRDPGHPHPFLAGAEIALLGEARPGERHPEGPFGDHYGYYSLRHDYPVFRCHTMYHRDGAVFPATVVGKPRQEDFYLGDYLQELLAPIFPLVMPQVRDLWAYGETGYHALAAAVVADRYPREAMVCAFRILGEGQLSLTKFLLLVDRPMDLRRFGEVLSHVLARARFETDLYVFSALSMDTLDYTGPEVNRGSKGVLLGLGEPVRELRATFTGSPRLDLDDIRPFVPGCLVVQGASFENARDLPGRIAGDGAFRDWPLVVLVDDARRTVASEINFLWTVFTRFEPAADVHAASTRVHRHHLVYESPIVIDARMKPWYPAELSCDDDTRRRVDRLWSIYFPAGGVAMGSSEQGHLAPG